MSSLLALTLILLSTITLTVVKRKIKVRRRIRANDEIVKEIVEKIERYEREKNQNR
jgi:hypothetical protein